MLRNSETLKKKYTNTFSKNWIKYSMVNKLYHIIKTKRLKNISTAHKLQSPSNTHHKHNPNTSSTPRQCHSSRCPNPTRPTKTPTYFWITRNTTTCGTCGKRNSSTGTTTKTRRATKDIKRKNPTVNWSSPTSVMELWPARDKMSEQISLTKIRKQEMRGTMWMRMNDQ